MQLPPTVAANQALRRAGRDRAPWVSVRRLTLALLLCASAAIVPAAAGSAHGGGQGGPHGTGGPGESGGSGGSGGSSSGGSSGDTSDGSPVTVAFPTASGSVTYHNPYSPPSATVSGGSATVTYAITGANTAGCSIDANESNFHYTSTGTCVVTASATTVSTTDDDHDGTATASASFTLTVNPGGRTLSLVASSSSAQVGTPITLTATPSAGTGAITYSIVADSASGCAIVNTDKIVATVKDACSVTATIAADGDYTSATSPAVTVNFVPAPPPPPPPPPPPHQSPPVPTTTTTLAPVHLTIAAPSQVVKKGQPIRTAVSVSGVHAGDTVRVTGVTLTYTGIGGTSYGPNSAPPGQVGVYSVTPSHATITVSPSSDAALYGSILYVAGTLQILVPDLVIKAAPPKLSPTRSLAIKPFAEGSYALNRKLVKQVARLALVVKRGKYHSVALTGFTDNVFTPAFNVMLNQRRAAAVEARLHADLARLHVSNVKISIVTSFSVQLVSTNTTAKGRAQNRRVVAVLRAL